MVTTARLPERERQMRVSELVERSGVPLATIKFYLREGLLMPGVATSATQANYGDEHLRRLSVIRALTDVVGLTVQKAGEVIRVIDAPGSDIYSTLGKAVSALPPYPEQVDVAATASPNDYPRARAALARIGQVYDPDYAAVRQLERALRAAEEAGLPMSQERLDRYAEHVRGIAQIDIEGVPGESPASAVEYAVLGTALYEPIISALRRLAHQDLAMRRFARESDQ
jgi:DNA-binding transcriptional MerR regulator